MIIHLFNPEFHDETQKQQQHSNFLMTHASRCSFEREDLIELTKLTTSKEV